MDGGSGRRAREFEEALRRGIERESGLKRGPALQNGTADLTVSLADGSAERRALLRIRGRDSTLLLVVDRASGERREEPIDLRFEDGYCWDEMVCGTADELAEIFLQHIQWRLESGFDPGRGAEEDGGRA